MRSRSAALLLAGALLSCTDSPTGSGMAAPDPGAIFVFFPSGSSASNGLVRGRGLPGSVPEAASHVLVESYPTGHSVVAEVAPDGSFDFEIIAISGDVLEVRGAESERLDALGAPVFVRVPRSIEPFVRHVCCFETNVCVPEAMLEFIDECPPSTPGVPTCQTDAQCGIFEGEYYDLDPSMVRVSPPDASGNAVVEGTLVPNTLVTLRNRGKSAVGAHLTDDERRRRGLENPDIRLNQITDAQGRFRFSRLRAIADDELILRLEDLQGFRTPLYATRVPDPPLAGVDVLGVFPWAPLTNGERGTVALRVSPYGEDGRGLCPDQVAPRDGLELCLGGGFGHEMIAGFSRATIDFGAGGAGAALAPVPTSTNANTPYNRGIEGNVRSPRLDLFVVLDMSEAAASADPDGFTFDAVRSYVRYLRARDRVGLVTFGSGDPRLEVDLTEDRGLVDATLARLTTTARAGEPDLLPAVLAAAEALEARASGFPGRIVVITFAPPMGPPNIAREAVDEVLDVVERKPLQSFAGYPIDVVGVPVPTSAPTLVALEDLATFSQGRLESATSASLLEQTLSDLRGEQVGSFILLYDVSIPVDAGKAGNVELQFQVQVGSVSRTASYEGPLFIANAPNP